MCKISIIVPVYNVEKYIAECIESVLNQNFEDYELILVDDGSKDNSLSICREYAEKDERIRVFSKENGGVSSARNFGFDKAEGEYITFIDSDDYVSPDYCSILLSYMNESIGMVVLGLQKVFTDGRISPIKHRLPEGVYSYENLAPQIIDDGTMSGFTVHSSCAILYRSEHIKTACLLFNSKVKYNEDGLFNAEYFITCGKDAYINYSQVIYSYRTNLQSATQVVDLFSERYEESMRIIEEVLNDYSNKYPSALIKPQLARRQITLALSKSIYLARKKELTTKKLSLLFKNNETKAGFKMLDKQKMGKQKLLMSNVLKLRLYLPASLMLKMRYK